MTKNNTHCLRFGFLNRTRKKIILFYYMESLKILVQLIVKIIKSYKFFLEMNFVKILMF